ncbi:MAG: hypothetical protein LBV63_03380 [Candidatus Methanoplasma sp.]|jgi:uncharacterized repeat protein (TIGR04076 family)|nr:hypothetical protein [Candidatus Methanoplasma sp.]
MTDDGNPAFTLTVLDVADEDEGVCNMGYKVGDRIKFGQTVPIRVCPRTKRRIQSLCDVILKGGDFTTEGSSEPYRIEFCCGEGTVTFVLEAAVGDHSGVPSDP